MKKTDTLTKVLAVVGTVLVWFPILVPVILTLSSFVTRHIFRFDYLMPAELFLFALAGGGLLVWAAFRVRIYRRIIGWSLGTAIGMLVGGQVLAVLTGLASGENESIGWRWIFVLGSLGIFSLALVVLGVGGVLLVHDLFKPSRLPTSTN
ncbi:MAG: hypothetical protein WBV22_09000 [Anaerolineaceae bacterium]